MKFGTRFAMPRRVVRSRAARGSRASAPPSTTASASARKAVVVATGVQYRRLPIDRLEPISRAPESITPRPRSRRATAREPRRSSLAAATRRARPPCFLSRSASCVRVLVRGASLAASMSSYLSSRLEADPRIQIEYDAEVTALHGTDHLEALTIRDAKTGCDPPRRARALFIMVGASPNTEWLSGLVELDDKGFVITGSDVGVGRLALRHLAARHLRRGRCARGIGQARRLLRRRRIGRDLEGLGVRQPQWLACLTCYRDSSPAPRGM